MVNLPVETENLAHIVAYWERLSLSKFVAQAIEEKAERLEKKRGEPYAQRPEAGAQG